MVPQDLDQGIFPIPSRKNSDLYPVEWINFGVGKVIIDDDCHRSTI
ncbi:16265_t:CDS:1, partial [Cetraspora pellucida]